MVTEESNMPSSFGVPWPDFNDGISYHDVVSPSDSGLTLIDFYSNKHKSSAPLQGWFQRINNGQIKVDGEVVTDADLILRAGSELVYGRLPWKEPDAPCMLQVLYEDDDLVALNKPSGLQVLPGGLFQQRTVLKQLQWSASRWGTPLPGQESHPIPVHRLGRGTSGILLCARSKNSKACLASYFAGATSVLKSPRGMNLELGEERKITKFYRALASGIIGVDEIAINQPIGMIRYPGVARGLYVALASGRPALSRVTVLERRIQKNVTLVQVEIQSGRPHQIRIHLAFIGHPLLGDPLYSKGGLPNCEGIELEDESFADDGGYLRPANPVPGDCGYLLHSHQVVLWHPIKNEMIKITAPLPNILKMINDEE